MKTLFEQLVERIPGLEISQSFSSLEWIFKYKNMEVRFEESNFILYDQRTIMWMLANRLAPILRDKLIEMKPLLSSTTLQLFEREE